MLYANGRMVARSNDDGNGKDDNSIVTMFYSGRAMTEDVDFKLVAHPSGSKFDARITPRHFHLGYTTYGPGHAWHECMVIEPAEDMFCSFDDQCQGDRRCG